MTARRFPCAFAFLGIMILLEIDHTAYGRQEAAEARSQTKEKSEKTDGKPRTVQVATIKKTDLYNYEGRYQVTAYPSRTAKLYTNTSGTVRGLKLRLGDRVKQGETIAEIESAELRREIETRELSVRRAEIALERTKAEIRRMEKLIDIKKAEPFDTKKKPETIESELGVLRDELEIAKFKMKEAKIHFEEAKLSLNQARERLATACYVAPFDGELIEVNVEDGDRVAPTGVETGKPAFVLGDFRLIHFKYENGTITARFGGDFAEPGMKALVFDTSDLEDLKPRAIGIVSRVKPYHKAFGRIRPFIVEAPNPDYKYKYLEDKWISIRTEFHKGVLTLQSRSVMHNYIDKLIQEYCYIVMNGVIKKTKIQTKSAGYDKDAGMLYGSTYNMFEKNMSIKHTIEPNEVYEIESGLKEGDVVVVAVESGSIDDLVDGEKVVIKPANEKDQSDR